MREGPTRSREQCRTVRHARVGGWMGSQAGRGESSGTLKFASAIHRVVRLYISKSLTTSRKLGTQATSVDTSLVHRAINLTLELVLQCRVQTSPLISLGFSRELGNTRDVNIVSS